MRKIFLSLLLGTVMGISGAMAQQGPAHDLKEIQKSQQARITQGEKSGRLTHGEVNALKSEQQEIERMINQALADRVVSSRERRTIVSKQKTAEKNITREKKDKSHKKRK